VLQQGVLLNGILMLHQHNFFKTAQHLNLTMQVKDRRETDVDWCVCSAVWSDTKQTGSICSQGTLICCMNTV
jgi:hypothetical protein